MKATTVLPLAAASLLLATPVLHAGEPDLVAPIAPAPASDAWEFSLSPYIMLAGIEGDLTIASGFGPIDANIDYDFSELLNDLDAFVMIAGEARRGRFSLQGDFIYLGVTPDGYTRRRGYDRAKLELDAIIATGLAAYRVWDEPSGFLELGAGARVFHVATEISLIDSEGILPLLGTDGSSTVLDAVAAVRFTWQVNEKWSLRFYGDIGGGDSDLTWQAWANIGYALSDRTTLFVGYRYLDYEFSKGRTDLDMSFSGPQLGVVFEF